jgi:hypothetical protein
MDVISYGIASKAAKQEQFTRNDVLGIGVEGTHPHVKARIDNLEKAIQGVVAQADKLIVNDAINIMKAHAKLNAVAKSMKYKMYNMIFDDLLDLSGIDTTKSSGYVHDATNGLIKANGTGNYTIVTKIENTEIVPEKAILVVEESLTNYALQFNGINQYINIPYATVLAPTNEIRVEVRASANWKTITDINHLVSKTQSGGYAIVLNDSVVSAAGKIVFAVRVNGVYRTAGALLSNLSDGFHTFTGSFDGRYIKFYVDGTLIETTDVGGTYPIQYSYNNSLLIGVDVGTGNLPDTNAGTSYKYFNGLIDYVKIWNKANGTSGLIGCWELNEGSGTQVKDSSGNNNHGTTVNGPTWIDISTPNSVPIGNYSLSRNGGITFESIIPETLFYFTAKSPQDNKLVLKAELPANVQLLNYALTWA